MYVLSPNVFRSIFFNTFETMLFAAVFFKIEIDQDPNLIFSYPFSMLDVLMFTLFIQSLALSTLLAMLTPLSYNINCQSIIIRRHEHGY